MIEINDKKNESDIIKILIKISLNQNVLPVQKWIKIIVSYDAPKIFGELHKVL